MLKGRVSYEKKKLLDPETLRTAVAELADMADKHDVDLALLGGFALQLYGSPRLTGDVDVTADQPISALPVLKPLSFGGFQTETPSGVPVDYIIRDDVWEKLYEALSEHAVEHEGVDLPVATPEYLAATKLQSARPQDEQDLEWLIGSGVIDTAVAREIIEKHLGPFAAEEFDRMVEFVEWRRTRSNPERSRLKRRLSR